MQSNLDIPQHDIELPPSRSAHEICEQNYCYAVFRFTATLDIISFPIFRHKLRGKRIGALSEFDFRWRLLLSC